MMRETVGRAASGARVIAGVLLALGGIKFTVDGVLFAVASARPQLTPVVTADSPRPAESATAAPPKPSSDAPAAVMGEPIRPTLSIAAGPPRSEVFVNGVRRGNTPFLGEVSCKAGATVRIQIVPPKGAPLEVERPCKPGTLRVGK